MSQHPDGGAEFREEQSAPTRTSASANSDGGHHSTDSFQEPYISAALPVGSVLVCGAS